MKVFFPLMGMGNDSVLMGPQAMGIHERYADSLFCLLGGAPQISEQHGVPPFSSLSSRLEGSLKVSFSPSRNNKVKDEDCEFPAADSAQ